MVPPFRFFSALCDFFFEKFLMSQKSPPSSFLIFCNRMYVNKSQRVPLLHFRHYASFSKKKYGLFFFKKTIILFPVLSNMEGPRLARNFFKHLRKRRTLKGPLFQFCFGIVLIFSQFFPSKGPPSIFFDILQETGFSTSPKGGRC